MEGVARVIAGFMVGDGCARTMSGNYHYDFEEINNLFGVNLPENKVLLDEIESAVWEYFKEEVCELTIEEDFDFLFWLNACGLDEE